MADDPGTRPAPDEPAPSTPAASDVPALTVPGATDATGRIDRRVFLNTAWKVLGVGLVLEAAWTSYDILNPNDSNAVGGVIDAGPATDYATEGATYFAEGQFWLASSGGEVVALYQKCPHLGCKVPFNPATDRFECPCHGSKYNILGEYLEGPAPRGMDRFLIKVDSHDEVLVDTATLIPGPKRGVNTVAGSAADAPGGRAGGPGRVGEATS
jgi:cytochrome b6-f complex iron-sulfur subunit